MVISTLMSGYCARNFREFRPEDDVGHVIDSIDPNSAGGLLPKFAQGRKLGFDFLEPRPK